MSEPAKQSADNDEAILFDPDEECAPRNDTGYKSAAEIQADFEVGMLSADDRNPQQWPDEVPLDDPEVAAPDDQPAVELLLGGDEARAYLDEHAPLWRASRLPPGLPVHGRGWSGVWFSKTELAKWLAQQASHVKTELLY
jgi:hypothetical protein